MKVAIACESSSFQLKEQVKKHIISLGYEVVDVGQQREDENVLYFEASANLAERIQNGECERGIVFCGTGAGASLIANKFKGVYCVACESIFTAVFSLLRLCANLFYLSLSGAAGKFFLHSTEGGGVDNRRMIVLDIILGAFSCIYSNLFAYAVFYLLRWQDVLRQFYSINTSE